MPSKISMYTLRAKLFGAFTITVDDRPLTRFATDRERGLLTYLIASANRPHSRDALADFLWPDRDNEIARRSLRQSLSRLRAALDEHTPGLSEQLLTITAQTIRFNLAESGAIDLIAFQTLIAACQSHAHSNITTCIACAERLRRAVELHQGEFLAGLHPPDALPFDEWAAAMREQVRDQMVWALHHLVEWSTYRRHLETACEDARRLLAIDPWREEAHRQLMRLLAWGGDRNAALLQYEVCRRTLRKELGVEPESATRQLHEAILNDALPPVDLGQPQNPYRSLHAFTAADADRFFGRERYIAALIDAIQRQPFVIVVGPSGSGKSSLVHAGLMARVASLHGNTDVDQPFSVNMWRVVQFRPSGNPFFSLAAALAGPNPDKALPSQLAQALQSRHSSLRTESAALLNHPSERLLFVIDQFEEIFTLSPNQDVTEAFLDLLFAGLDGSAAQPPFLSCVATLRADFVAQALTNRHLADSLQANSIFLGPMDADELARAILEPARLEGVGLEPGLLERLLADVRSQPGSLPLLQFALTLLWEQQSERRLTHSAYAGLGGVAGALASYCDEIFNHLSHDEQVYAMRLFLQMVQVGEQTATTRRLVSRRELDETGWRIAQRLADARLLVTSQDVAGDEIVEVAHEALIQTWPRLRGWIESDREFRTWQGRLRASIHQWRVSGQDAGALLRGASLAEAERWRELRRDDLSALMLDYIERSLTQRQEELAAVLAQRQRERSHLLALRAQVALSEHNSDAALSLAMAAVAIHPSAQAQLLLSRAGYAPGTRRRLVGHTAPLLQVAFLPDLPGQRTQRALSAAADHTLILWNLTEGSIEQRFIGHHGPVYGVAVDGACKIAVSASADGELIVWDASTGALMRRLCWQGVELHCAAISHDGCIAVAGDAAGNVLVWDLTAGILRQRMEGHRGPVRCVALTCDGRRAITGGADHGVRIWDVKKGEARAVMPGHETLRTGEQPWLGHCAPVVAVAFAPDGHTAYSAAGDRIIFCWDAENGALIRGDSAAVGLASMALFHDGRRGALGTLDSRLLFYDLQRGAVSGHLFGHRGRVQTVAVADDDALALTGAADHEARLWDLQHGAETRRLTSAHTAISAGQIAISRDGHYLLAGHIDGSLTLWELTSGREMRHWVGHDDMIWAGVYFLPDNRYAISASGDVFGVARDATLRLWDVTTGAEVRRFVGHEKRIWDLGITTDGRYAVTGSHDGTLRRWEIATGECAVLLDLGPQDVLSLAVSPDGRTVLVGPGRGVSVDPSYALRQIDLATGCEVGRLVGHKEAVNATAISPNGRYAASGGHDKVILLWDLVERRLLHRLVGHTGSALDLLFTPDSRFLLSASHDKTVLLWDLQAGEAIRCYEGHNGIVFDLACLPDASGFFSTSEDATIRQWRIDATLDELLAWTRTNRYVDAEMGNHP
jgi:WD40 repeat protein/DNA-binding SARP family transcriptional activator